jgi:hypothetical protein
VFVILFFFFFFFFYLSSVLPNGKIFQVPKCDYPPIPKKERVSPKQDGTPDGWQVEQEERKGERSKEGEEEKEKKNERKDEEEGL